MSSEVEHPTRPSRRRRPEVRQLQGYRRHVLVLTGAFFILCMAWAATMPFFHGPDEIYHYNSVARIARGGGWPEPYTSPVLASTFNAIDESGRSLKDGVTGIVTSPSERSSFSDPGPHGERSTDQMLQHPPGYYIATAAPVKLLGVSRLRWDQAAIIMRAVSAALLATALPFMIGTVTRVTGNQLAGLLGGTSLIGIPFLSTMGGYVSNDILLISAGATATYAATRLALESDAPRYLPVVTGAALGVALFSKGYALLMVPAIAALAITAIIRHEPSSRWRLLGRLSIGGALTLALGGWWWIRNIIVLGYVQPSALRTVSHDADVHPDYRFTKFVTTSIDRLRSTFWDRGGRPGLALPDEITWIASLVLIGLIVFGVIAARRRLETLVLLTIPVLLGSTFLLNALRIYRVIVDSHSGIRGVQGRYLYSGLAGVAVCIGWAAMAIGRRIGGRGVRWATPALLILPWLAALGGLWWTVQRDRPARRQVRLSQDVHDWIGLPLAWVLPAICLALVLWTAVSVARDLRPPPATARIEPEGSAVTPAP